MATEIVLQGQGLLREYGTNTHCHISSIVYQGPAATLYFWAGVAQGNIIRWEEQGAGKIKSIAVPAMTTPGGVSVSVDFEMTPYPQGHAQAPYPEAGADGVVVIGTDPSMVTDPSKRLLVLTVIDAYAVTAPAALPPGQAVANITAVFS